MLETCRQRLTRIDVLLSLKWPLVALIVALLYRLLILYGGSECLNNVDQDEG